MLERERIEHWCSKGAQLSPIVKSLLRRSRRVAGAEAAAAPAEAG